MSSIEKPTDVSTIEAAQKMDFEPENVVAGSYNQGILILEGSSATIIGNRIERSNKANIALGGQGSGSTIIKENYVCNSKRGEGIFVVEGESELTIEENWIEKNQDGIVLLNSDGLVRNNIVRMNVRSGVVSAGYTSA